MRASSILKIETFERLRRHGMITVSHRELDDIESR